MKRLFIAAEIELSDNFNTLTKQLQHDLINGDIGWVRSRLQHLTLRFLGETPLTKIDSIAQILFDITNATTPFDLRLDKMGVFGTRYKPEVLWYGFSEFSLFKNLFEKLEKQLLNLSLEKNYGNFVPHTTVGRIKKIEDKKSFWKTIERLQPKFSQIIHVRELLLIQSKLTNDGPVYKTLSNFEMKNI
jgi:2'-5' RNA ligase